MSVPKRSGLGYFVRTPLGQREISNLGVPPEPPNELTIEENLQTVLAGVYLDEYDFDDGTNTSTLQGSFYVPMTETYDVGLRAWGQYLAGLGERWVVLSPDPLVATLGPIPGNEMDGKTFYLVKRPTQGTVTNADSSPTSVFIAQAPGSIPDPPANSGPTTKDIYLNASVKRTQAGNSGSESSFPHEEPSFASVYIAYVGELNGDTVITFLAGASFARTFGAGTEGYWSGRIVLYTSPV